MVHQWFQKIAQGLFLVLCFLQTLEHEVRLMYGPEWFNDQYQFVSDPVFASITAMWVFSLIVLAVTAKKRVKHDS